MSFFGPFVIALCLAAAAVWLPPPAPVTSQPNPLNGPLHILTQEH